MPLADAVETMRLTLPCRPEVRVPGGVTLAGTFTVCDGISVPSGRVWELADAEASEPAVARLAVQATESTASGSSADAFCARPNLATLIDRTSSWSLREATPSAG